MSIQGLNNSNFNLGNIGSLTNRTSASTSGGSFDLGNGSGGVSSSFTGSNSVGEGNLGLGDVNTKDANVENALNSVAGENAIQQQFKNQLSLINLQERIQSQSRTTEILTNILKSRHDTALDAARNLK
ncbi:MAG: hypothetical protein HY819_16600 [Acidobacteria bacterium]|nr:hypothetical protein [Acidobacteriota bacterium]